MTEIKQDPGEVFAALATAFGGLPPEAQSAAITHVYNALGSELERQLDDTGIAPEDAADHDGLRPLMLAINMVKAVFGSEGRVHVFRAAEAALIVQVTRPPHVEAHVIEAANGPLATDVVKTLAKQVGGHPRSTPPAV
ncbi:MAG: hypothetical protein AB7W59_00270 [Acidimicrobiia bacterium]